MQQQQAFTAPLHLCQVYQMQYPHDWSCRPGLEGILRSDPGPEPPAGPAAPLEVPQGVQNHLRMTHVSGSSVGSAPVAAL